VYAGNVEMALRKTDHLCKMCNPFIFYKRKDVKASLLEAATDLVELLIDYTGIEPKLVSGVCQELIMAGGSDIGNISTSLAMLAEPLTNIALTLHRHPEYREVGLRMFEELIFLNIRETRAALDILDRKPIKTVTKPFRPRRRRKKTS
jgi:hypothetical protein